MPVELAAPRPMRPDDLEAVHRLVRRSEIADAVPLITPIEELEELLLEAPGVDPVHDVVVVDHPDEPGELIALAFVTFEPVDGDVQRADVWGCVDPDRRRRGLGTAVGRWAVDRARARLELHPATQRIVRTDVWDWLDESRRLCARLGMSEDRWFHELIRPLDTLLEVEPPEGVTIRPLVPADHEAVRVVLNDAFADHWGSVPRSPESFAGDLASYATRIDLCRVAERAGVVIGALIVTHFPGDVEVTGRIEGWVQRVGVLRSHRGTGVASALIADALAGFVDAGFDHAALGVDSSNPTGAYGLYERLGFVPVRATVTCRLEW